MRVEFPAACLSKAITPKKKGDEDKIALGLHRIIEEDQTVKYDNNKETRQQLISGLGEQHLDYVVSKLRAKFGVEVELSTPIVPYRETIRKKVSAEGKFKKQTGGHGQYGHVFIDFEPCDSEELVFEEKVVGGSVPKNYFPAVEKGLRECVNHGTLAGYPVVNLKATLTDGSYHPVDSSEAAFKAAATLSFKAGMAQASPVLLEPIGTLKVTMPEGNMGDVIGEINRRRGRVMGMSSGEKGTQIVEAEAPVAETMDFSVVLRSITQGRGSFTFEFARYEEAPPQVSQAVIEKAKVKAAE
jgi:elongation factor G